MSKNNLELILNTLPAYASGLNGNSNYILCAHVKAVMITIKNIFIHKNKSKFTDSIHKKLKYLYIVEKQL